MLRMQQGRRSSISAGGQVQYPDLELLPRLERDFVYPTSDQRITSSFYSSDKDKSPKFDAVDYEGDEYGSDMDTQDMPGYSDHASTLSKMYQQTIYGGTRTVSTSTEASRHAYHRYNNSSRLEESALDMPTTRPDFLMPEYRPKHLTGSSHLLSPSKSDSEMAVRRSTLDFAKDVKEHKMQSHQLLMDTIDGISDST